MLKSHEQWLDKVQILVLTLKEPYNEVVVCTSVPPLGILCLWIRLRMTYCLVYVAVIAVVAAAYHDDCWYCK